MTKGFKTLAVAALTLIVGMAGQAAFANCIGEGPYEQRQCNISWFDPPPGGGTVTATQWWAIGYGNQPLDYTHVGTGQNAAQDGSCFISAPSPGVFVGCDSGLLDTAGAGLIDAGQFGGPAGSLCFGPTANWANPPVDGCGDVSRTYAAGQNTATTSISNQYLNNYFGGAGPIAGYRYYYNQVDPPMGVLMKESNNLSFALAFFATRDRGKNETDIAPGEYNAGAVHHGGISPTGDNVVQWLPIPQPVISAVLQVPSDPNSLRNLTFTWTPVAKIISDDSTRPCFKSDNTTACGPCVVGGAPLTCQGGGFAPGVSGVGTADQGPLVHYDVEVAPLDPNTGICGTTFTKVVRTDHPASTTNANGIAPNSCVRLATRFGKNPAQTALTVASAANQSTNRFWAATGQLGDLGYQVESRVTKVGGPTISQKATLTGANRNKNSIQIKWETNTETNITSFDILATDAKGNQKVVGSKACSQCTSGLGASYSELIPSNSFQGAKRVQIRSNPSGTLSNTLDVK